MISFLSARFSFCPQESKVKGKAAIDVLAARIGKSGGALLQQVIVLYFGNVISGRSISRT
jgi:ATP/ADP translocase